MDEMSEFVLFDNGQFLLDLQSRDFLIRADSELFSFEILEDYPFDESREWKVAEVETVKGIKNYIEADVILDMLLFTLPRLKSLPERKALNQLINKIKARMAEAEDYDD